MWWQLKHLHETKQAPSAEVDHEMQLKATEKANKQLAKNTVYMIKCPCGQALLGKQCSFTTRTAEYYLYKCHHNTEVSSRCHMHFFCLTGNTRTNRKSTKLGLSIICVNSKWKEWTTGCNDSYLLLSKTMAMRNVGQSTSLQQICQCSNSPVSYKGWAGATWSNTDQHHTT